MTATTLTPGPHRSIKLTISALRPDCETAISKGRPLKPANVWWQNENQLRFILRQGKKRQIRRMCELVGLQVVGLKRIRVGNVLLGDLPSGKWRYLAPDESF